MRSSRRLMIVLGALVLAGSSTRAEEPMTPPPLQPAKPASGASLDIYIKVKNQVLDEYCKAEGLGVPRCTPNAMYEAKDTCAPPYKVAAVSCSLSDLGSEPRLVESAAGDKQATGTCVWAFGKLAADTAPSATTTLLCVK